MAEPYSIAEGSFSVEQNGLTSISPVFLVPGPVGPEDHEPYGILRRWKPDTDPLGLPEVDRNAKKRQDGDWDLTIHYMGVVEGEGALGFTVELDMTRVEDPIETFDEFEALAKKWNGKIVRENDGFEFKGFSYKIKDPVSGRQVKNRFFGVTHFLNNNPTLNIEFGEKRFDTSFLEGINTIETPLVTDELAQIRDGVGNRTWLKTSVKASFKGNVWIYRIQYELADWSTDLYGPKPR